MTNSRFLIALAASTALGGVAAAQTGAAITVIKVGVDGGNTNDFVYYGQNAGIGAYSFATTSCNPGTSQVVWTSSNHPVIGQNIFRFKDGRFEQLGQSWLKHGFCAVNEAGCGACQSTPCSTLGIGCADTYWATLNDGQGGGPKWQVNAANGINNPSYPAPTGNATIRGRLQVQTAEIDPAVNGNGDAEYFAEGQYVSRDVCDDANGSIANSWRRINVIAFNNLDGGGPTNVNEPAIFAWRDYDPTVQIQDIFTGEFAGSGRFTVGSTVSGTGPWTYRYCIENISSDRSGYSFELPIPDSIALSNVFFRDVEYHSGEPFSNTDWLFEHSGDVARWRSTQTFAENANANALRWGTMYTFEFTANSAPLTGQAELTLFKTGAGNDVNPFNVLMPGGQPAVGTAYCSGDGSGAICPCLNFGNPNRGCSNGTFFQGAGLTASGAASVSADTLVLEVDLATPNQPGLMFVGDQQVLGGNGQPFGDGLRCAGGNVIRLETMTPGAGGVGQTTIALGAASNADAGDTLHYQFWYRDPNASPCGSLFNLSNGLSVDWTN